jgi:hypothetical protein
MKTKKSINVKQLLNCIPCEKFTQVAEVTGVNHQVKKLNGEVVFKLLLMSVLSSEKISLRVMEDLYKSKRFRLLAELDTASTTRHTSLSDRLMNIKAQYFEQLFDIAYQQLSSNYPTEEISKHHILRYDSTCISASAKLLKTGIINGQPDKAGVHQLKQVKVSIGFDGIITRKVKIYNQQKHAADDEVLRETILESKKEKNEIVVFDRGLKKRKTFAEIADQDKLFVTRIAATKTYDIIKTIADVSGKQTDTLKLISDEQVYLYHEGHIKFKVPFRLIRAQSLQSRERLFFVTNILDMDAQTITEIYKRRWDIEVFFKFLKQEMNFKHFISYSENGIKVMIYVTLIAAMLIMIYKKINDLESFKRAKKLFIEELDTELIRQIVVLCGGNPDASPYLKPP